MRRLATRAKALWRDVLCFVSMIAFIIAASLFLVLFLMAGMAFCLAIFFVGHIDRLIARREEERSILSDLRDAIRDSVVANKSDLVN
jgi:hypothetical protein